MSSLKRTKHWKKETFSKKLTKPYQVNEADKSFMQDILLHADDSILAFNKPSGLACQTRNPDDRTFDSLLAVYAKSNGKMPRMVHRLDALTSGMIVTARTKPAAAFISEAFAKRETRKVYHAIVQGEDFKTVKGKIDLPLIRYRKAPSLELMRPAKLKEKDEAQEACTEYEVMQSNGGVHLVRLVPKTGRMHQLRVHLSAIGRPIIGDPYYNEAQQQEDWGEVRLMLHASRLVLPHPQTGTFDMTAPLQEDMRNFAIMVGLEKGLLAIDGETG